MGLRKHSTSFAANGEVERERRLSELASRPRAPGTPPLTTAQEMATRADGEIMDIAADERRRSIAVPAQKPTEGDLTFKVNIKQEEISPALSFRYCLISCRYR